MVAPFIELRAQVLANAKYLFPGRNLELITGNAVTGSGTAYIVDLDRNAIEKKGQEPAVLLTAKTESDELGAGLHEMLKETKKLVRDRIDGKWPAE